MKTKTLIREWRDRAKNKVIRASKSELTQLSVAKDLLVQARIIYACALELEELEKESIE